MADLTAGVDSPYRGDRAQIILIAAFTLAVAFVALALVVNSAIFTENLASRGEVAGSSEALLYQHQVRESVGAAMAFANVYNHSSDTSLANSLEGSAGEIGIQGGSQQVLGGQVANVSGVSPEDGYRFADNTSGGSDFQNVTGASNWTLAENVDSLRDFQIEITDPDELESLSESPLTFEANGSSIYKIRVADQSGDLVIQVRRGGTAAKCQFDPSTSYEIDVTGGTVDGERCHALTYNGTADEPMWWGKNVNSNYEVWIKNGSNVRGNYSFVARPAANPVYVPEGPVSGNPYYTNAIYSADVDYVFVTRNVRYEAVLRVAPGEVPP